LSAINSSQRKSSEFTDWQRKCLYSDMPMINAEVIKAVQDLLHERGIEQKQKERLADYVARGLKLSHAQTEAFLEALHSGKTVDEAREVAGIPEGEPQSSFLVAVAKRIGTSLGRVAAPVQAAQDMLKGS